MSTGDTNRFSKQPTAPAKGKAPPYLSMADIAVFLSPTGQVTDVAGHGGRIPAGAEDWQGAQLLDLVELSMRGPVERAMNGARQGSANATRLQINMTLTSGERLPLQVSFLVIDDRLAMLGLDQGLLAEAVSRADRLQAAIESFEDEERSARAVHRTLLTHLDQALVLVDVSTGRVLDLTGPAVAMLGLSGDAQSGSSGLAFTQCFDGRRRSEFIDSLSAASMSKRTVLADLRSKNRKIAVAPRMTRINGSPVLVCRLSFPEDAPSTGMADFTTLAERTTDAMICIDGAGLITRVNPAFLGLVDAVAEASVLGRPLSGFLARGTIDLKALTDTDRPRSFATKALALTGERIAIEIAVADLGDGDLGLTLRETTHASLSRNVTPLPVDDATTPERFDPAQQVGTAPLRDIVAGMTDAIERDCIEAAITLTQNNRVAAAEMLGLSRQSLYVKLRKFGLLDRSDH